MISYVIIFLIIVLIIVIRYWVVEYLSYKNDTKILQESNTSRIRGTPSERSAILKLVKSGIASKSIFHDLYVKKKNGEFSQIDLVIPTKVGIIVI